jgi:hypothetical protein
MSITSARLPLTERIRNYPTAAPQDLITLINTDAEVIVDDASMTDVETSTALDLRREVLEAIRAHQRRPITGPEVVLDMLTGRYRQLKPLAARWMTYVLNDRRERKLVPHPNGSGDLVYPSDVAKQPPSSDRLQDKLPLAHGEQYLIIYGGSPAVLSQDGAAEKIAALKSAAPVADVLFWHLQTGQPGTLYSLLKGMGDQGGQAVEFPDQTALEIARNA